MPGANDKRVLVPRAPRVERNSAAGWRTRRELAIQLSVLRSFDRPLSLENGFQVPFSSHVVICLKPHDARARLRVLVSKPSLPTFTYRASRFLILTPADRHP